MSLLLQSVGLPCVCFCQDAKAEQADAAERCGAELEAVLPEPPPHAAIVIADSAVRMTPAAVRMNVPP
jgi:hypothetical protein